MITTPSRQEPPSSRWLAAVFGLALVVMTWPFVNYRALGEATYGSDALLIVWSLAWDNHAVTAGVPLFRSNIFYPAPETLQYNEHLFGLSLFTLPWTWLGRSPVFAHNATWWLAYIGNAAATFLLLRRFVSTPAAAFVGSLVFTFSFYVQLHAPGHLHLIWLWGIPLSLWQLERWFDRPGLARVVEWALVVALEALTSWYLAVIVGIANGIYALVLVSTDAEGGDATGPATRTRQWGRRVACAVVGAVTIAALVAPFARHYGGLRTAAGTASGLSATVASYVIPPAHTLLGRWWLAHIDTQPGSIWGETTLYLGWVTIVLATGGVVVLMRGQASSRRAWTFVLLAVAGFLLSLGPTPAWPGAESLAPFGWLARLPGFAGMRAPARFAVLVTLGAAGLVALAIDRLLAHPSAVRRLAVATLVPLMLAEWFVVDFPAGAPQVMAVPPIYRSPEVQNARALVSLPDYSQDAAWYLGGDYLYYSTAHWRPIVNGFGRTEPPGHADLIGMTARFPATADTLRDLGIQYVVVHTDRLADRGVAMLAAATRSPACRLVRQVGPDYLFELGRWSASSTPRLGPEHRAASDPAESGLQPAAS